MKQHGTARQNRVDRTRQELLAAFVPRLALELDVDRRVTESGSLYASIDGSMLSADISGFTSLSERQSAKGKAGAEVLAEIISSCFTDLIEAAYEYDGEIIKFGGDALLVLFRGDDHGRRAAGTGLAMQRTLGASTAARRSKLTMTVGVAGGPFDTFLAGDPRSELLIISGAADRVIQLESDAGQGETLVSPDIAELFEPHEIVNEHHGGGVLSPDVAVAGCRIHERTMPEEPLERFIPGAVADQLDAFAELGGEHRFATVGFLMATGVAELVEADPQLAAREIGALVNRIAEAGHRFGVTPLETDIASDGFKFVLSAGAPLAVGNTSDALLQTALDIVKHETPLELRIGVQTGRVFAGFIGHPYRWTYTMMGDCMSTAARMLGRAADREVIAVGDVIDDTRTPFSTDQLDPFRVKGKSAPITAHRVLGVDGADERRAVDAPLFGVEEQLTSATAALQQRGGWVEVTGGPGSGKSAFINAVLAGLIGPLSEAGGADEIGWTVARMVAHQHGGSGPYSDVRPLISSALGIGRETASADAETRLDAIMSELTPQLLPLLPLVADVIGVDVDPTPESGAITHDFRRSVTIDTTVELLRALPLDRTVLVIDDAQWLDESSAQLLQAIDATGGDESRQEWSLIVAGRTDADRSQQEPSDIDSDHRVSVILGPLPDAAIRQLAIDRCERALSDAELKAVLTRANGNPLFAVELVRAFATHAGSALPDSVEKLIATRIDALAPTMRRLVRLAAVIGRDFDSETLASLLSTESSSDVRRLLHHELSEFIVARPDDRWEFAQTIHREVAYEGLPYRQRRRLHASVGDRLEASIETDADALAATLAVHWSEAHEYERAWKFAVLAGERALRLSAPNDAIASFELALHAGRHTRAVTKRQRSRIAKKLGDAAEIAGRYDLATNSYTAARRLLASDDPDQFSLFRKSGIVHEREGNYERAVGWYRRGLDASTTIDHAEDDEAAELAVAVAGIRFRQARYADCRDAARPIADDVAIPPATRLRACYVIQIATQYLGDFAIRDQYGELGVRLADRVDEPVLESNLYNNLGISAYYEGDWDRAAELYTESLELRESVGDQIGAVTSLNNIGEVRSDQRRFDEAVDLFEEALRRAGAAGYEMAIHVVRANLGRLATRQGRSSDARTLLLDALAAFEKIDAAGFVLETRLRLIEAEAAERLDEAAIRELLSDNERIGGGATVEVPARRLLAVHLRQSGDRIAAQSHLAAALDIARSERLDVEVAACLDEAVLLADDQPSSDGAQREADAIRLRLGVV